MAPGVCRGRAAEAERCSSICGVGTLVRVASDRGARDDISSAYCILHCLAGSLSILQETPAHGH